MKRSSHPAKALQRTSLSPHFSIMIPAIVLDALIVIACWEDPLRRWLLIGICVVWGGANAVLLPVISKKVNETLLTQIREYGNAVGHALKVIVSQAVLPTWGWLIVFGAMTDNTGSIFSRKSVLFLLAIQTGLSLYFGIDWLMLVTFMAFTIMTTALSIARSQTLYDAIAEQNRQRMEAERAKQRLLEMQELATQQEKLSSLGMLASGVAHEINNPMSFVTSNVNQLVNDLPKLGSSSHLVSEYQDEILPETIEGIKRVNTIVGDLRRFAQGDVEAASSFELSESIQAAIRITHGSLTPGVTLDEKLVPLPRQNGFPGQVTQVAAKLLVNAARAVEGGGCISLRCGEVPDWIWFSVSDDGPGISQKILPKMFEPFFTTKPLGKGSGLGLSVVHGIVTQLNGRIDVESTEGEGTTFTVWLPCSVSP